MSETKYLYLNDPKDLIRLCQTLHAELTDSPHWEDLSEIQQAYVGEIVEGLVSCNGNLDRYAAHCGRVSASAFPAPEREAILHYAAVVRAVIHAREIDPGARKPDPEPEPSSTSEEEEEEETADLPDPKESDFDV